MERKLLVIALLIYGSIAILDAGDFPSKKRDYADAEIHSNISDSDLFSIHQDEARRRRQFDVIYAAGTGNLPVVESWFTRRSRLSPKDLLLLRSPKNGATALMWAAMHNYAPVVKYLLQRAEYENVVHPLLMAEGYDGGTALSWSTTYGHDGIMKMLLEAAEKEDPSLGFAYDLISYKTNTGVTTLMNAAGSGNRNAVKLILDVARKSSTDVEFLGFINAQDNYNGRTALHWAVRYVQGASQKKREQHTAEEIRTVIQEILKYPGVDLTIRDTFGNTVIYWAAQFLPSALQDFKAYIDKQQNAPDLKRIYDQEIQRAMQYAGK
jgi:ankyrin repeat protein